MTDATESTKEPDAPPDGLAVWIDQKTGKPACGNVGQGLPPYTAPSILRKVAKVLEDQMLA